MEKGMLLPTFGLNSHKNDEPHIKHLDVSEGVFFVCELLFKFLSNTVR